MDFLKAEYNYESLHLVCDTATVEQMHSLLRTVLNVDLPVPNGMVVRGVAISREPSPRPNWNWRQIAVLAIGMAMSGLLFVAGVIKVAEWISMFLL